MKRSHVRRSAALIAASMLVAATPAAAQAVRYELDGQATRISFDASATLGRFSGDAQRVSGWADVRDTATFAGTRGEVHVDAASFGTGIALRNRHLRDEMETERYPFVSFVLDGVEPAGRTDGGGRAVVLRGRLTIKAVTREVEIPATVARDGAAFVIDGRLPAKFTGFGMRPPTRMAGATRVRDDLVLRFHAVFRRAGS